jgi:hypothetical protein
MDALFLALTVLLSALSLGLIAVCQALTEAKP